MVVEDDFLMPLKSIGFFRIVASTPPYLRFGNLPAYSKTIYGENLPGHARGDFTAQRHIRTD